MNEANEKKVQVDICYMSLLADCLNAIKKDDYKVIREYGYELEFQEGFLQDWVDDLLENFCKPLIEYDKDTEIILENKQL